MSKSSFIFDICTRIAKAIEHKVILVGILYKVLQVTSKRLYIYIAATTDKRNYEKLPFLLGEHSLSIFRVEELATDVSYLALLFL